MMSKSSAWKRPLTAVAAPCMAFVMLVCSSSLASSTASNTFASATFEQLLVHAQRYGSTAEKRENKRLAREALFGRGAATLDELMGHMHIRNMWIQILADELVGKLESEAAVPVLLKYLDSEHEETRKLAAYFLGFYDTPEHTGRLLPLLKDDKAAGAAARTLGKWRAAEAVPAILPFLSHAEERRRVVAVNALGAIGEPSAAPHLIAALADDVFTVRKRAAAALVALGGKAERDVLRALPGADRSVTRELIPILARLNTWRSRRALRRLTKATDGKIRTEAAQALARPGME